jgi:uncharacterized protein involved in exopolysaccharide biosynthesis
MTWCVAPLFLGFVLGTALVVAACLLPEITEAARKLTRRKPK